MVRPCSSTGIRSAGIEKIKKKSKVTTVRIEPSREVEELEKAFEVLTLSRFDFNSKNDLLKNLRGKKISSRHFRTPKDLGEMPYDGSAIAIFSDPLDNTAEVSLKEATPEFKHADEIEGVKHAVFQRTNEQDRICGRFM